MLEHVKASEDRYKTHKRMIGMLTVISEVSKKNNLLFYICTICYFIYIYIYSFIHLFIYLLIKFY